MNLTIKQNKLQESMSKTIYKESFMNNWLEDNVRQEDDGKKTIE